MSQTPPYGYYYGDEADQYTFYRLPKALFTNDRYKDLSDGAKILYGLMLDRMGLSIKNGWTDEQDRVYIIFTLEDVQEYMNCQHGKAVKIFAELDTEKGVGLVERVRQGQGHPAIIYVRKFFDVAEVLTSENRKSGLPDMRKCRLPKNGSQDFRNSAANKNDISNNDFNEIDSNDTEIQSINPAAPAPQAQEQEQTQNQPPDGGIDRIDKIDKQQSATEIYREIIKDNIEYDTLCMDYDREKVTEILELILETVCSTRKIIHIGYENFPAAVVKSRFLKLGQFHVEYLLDCLHKNTTKINNIKSYLLTALYNAPATMSNYYSAEVNHDMYGSYREDGGGGKC